MSADVLIAGKLATGTTGQRVEIDANGILLTDGTDDKVTIPVSGDAVFKGGVQASSLTSESGLLRGATVVDIGGSFEFAAGVANPSAAPTVKWVWDEYDALGTGQGFWGMDYDSTSSRIITYSLGHLQIYGFPVAGGSYDWFYRFLSGVAGR